MTMTIYEATFPFVVGCITIFAPDDDAAVGCLKLGIALASIMDRLSSRSAKPQKGGSPKTASSVTQPNSAMSGWLGSQPALGGWCSRRTWMVRDRSILSNDRSSASGYAIPRSPDRSAMRSPRTRRMLPTSMPCGVTCTSAVPVSGSSCSMSISPRRRMLQAQFTTPPFPCSMHVAARFGAHLCLSLAAMAS